MNIRPYFITVLIGSLLAGCYAHGSKQHVHKHTHAATPAPTPAVSQSASTPVDTDCSVLRPADADLPSADAAEQLNSNRIRLFSWNAQKHLHELFHDHLMHAVNDVDLILLQESVADEQHLRENTLFHWSFSPGFVRDGVVTGVMTASHVKPVKSCNLTSTEPWIGSPKATSIALYRLSDTDQTLMVINTHLINFTLGTQAIRDQLGEALAYAEKHQGPLIVAGDLNTWNDRRERAVDESLRASGLVPIEFNRDQRTRYFGRPVDHIYVRGLEAVSADTYDVDSSDHNPLDTVLRVTS